MKNPAAQIRMQRGSDALGETVGLARHLPPDLRENVPHRDQTGILESVSSRRAYAARPPGRACTTRVARPFPAASGHHVDDFRHRFASISVSSLVADDEHDMRSFRGSRKPFRARENSSEREKACE